MVTELEIMTPGASVNVDPSVWRRATVPIQGSMYVAFWNTICVADRSELCNVVPIEVPDGADVITTVLDGACSPDP